MRITTLLTAGLAAVCWMAMPALADNINPPDWAGQPNTTMQQWEFYNNNDPAAPDIDQNPYGIASADPNPGSGQDWMSTWGGADGVWPLSGNIIVWIPNSEIQNPYKDIWIQITWAKQVFSSAPAVSAPDFPTAIVTEIDTVPLGPTGEPSPMDTWYHSTYNIRLPYNPVEEYVRIDGTIMVDELVIHTICAPEPMSLGLLALGGLALLRRRSL